jgi:large subunit ribosomal protein L25
MSDVVNLSAEIRERVGKGAARATRRAGRVPAVIYGAKFDPLSISLEPGDVIKHLHRPGFFGTVFEIEVDGKAHRVLARDVQLHPVTEKPMHVDFLRFSRDTKVEVGVPVKFINDEESPGLKRGGVLNVVRHEIDLVSAPDSIPNEIVIDLTGLEINDGIHISQVTLPEGVTPTITDRDFTIATIAAPSAVKAEAEEAAAEEAEAETEAVAEEAEAEEAAEEAEGEEE